MARKIPPLTDVKIRNAKAKEKEYSLTDGEGLSLRIRPNGSKIWLFNYYRPSDGKRTNIGFGQYPDITLVEARQKKREARELTKQGRDPKLQREQDRAIHQHKQSSTLRAVTEQFLEIKATQATASYVNKFKRSLEINIFPALGDYPISEITAPLVLTQLRKQEEIGKRENAKRLCQRINGVMDFAVNTGLIHSNPCSGVTKALKTPTPRKQPCIKPSELPELMQAIHRSAIMPQTKLLLEFQLHTMVRPVEAAHARWAEIDLETRIWTIPAERMKAKRPHSIPLNDYTLSIIRELQKVTSNREYLFVNLRDFNKPASSQTVNTALKRMGFEGRLVSHGFRALASTTLNEQGFDSDLIEVQLAHTERNQVRAAYNRAEYIEKRRDMLSWWGDFIGQSMAKGITL